jgi:hypothetical protein
MLAAFFTPTVPLTADLDRSQAPAMRGMHAPLNHVAAAAVVV